MYRTVDRSCMIFMLTALVTVIRQAFPADSHIVAHWLFNEGTDTILNDASGNGHQGIIHGAKWTANGLSFGGGDYVAVEDDSTFELGGDWTIEYKAVFSGITIRDVPGCGIVFSRSTGSGIDYAVGTFPLFNNSFMNHQYYAHTDVYLQRTPTDTLHCQVMDRFTPAPDRIAIVKQGTLINIFHDSRIVYRTHAPPASISGDGIVRIGALVADTGTAVINRYGFRGQLQELKIADTALYTPSIERVNGLVAQWNFDESSGDTATDISGNGHHGIITGAIRTDGVSGSSLTFLDSGCVAVSRHPHFNIDSALTIIAWVRTYSPGGAQTIIDRYSTSHGYSLGLENRKPAAAVGNTINNSTIANPLVAAAALQVDRWHLVALTVAGDTARLFIDTMITRSVATSASIGFDDTTLYIGRQISVNRAAQYFNGSLDEISIYDIALPPDSITSLYRRITAAAPADTSAPVIIINGSGTVIILQGRPYGDAGATAWDGNDGEITDSIQVNNPADTLTPGVYRVVYTITNSAGKKATASRTVTVQPDTLAPVISLAGDRIVYLTKGDTFVEPGYSAIEYPAKQTVTGLVEVNSNLNTAVNGTYRIVYSVTDPMGLTATAARTVIVRDLPCRVAIRLNQLGYYPSQKKTACIAGFDGDTFDILSSRDNSVVFTGALSDSVKNGNSDEYIRIADFSPLSEPGDYVLRCRGFGYSYQFAVTNSVYGEVSRAALKAYYFQRCSTPIEYRYGGTYARPAGHPDTACPAYSDSKQIRPLRGGWYDAGDYGKYIVNGGITLGTLLSLHELCPGRFGDSLMNIPETGNGRDDLLDEIKWELDWFTTMQDTSGGVYFKMGPGGWPGFIMPENDRATRYFYPMSTTSALNFAAVTAQAARVFKGFDSTYAAECLQRAEKAWKWAEKNPDVAHPRETGGTGQYDDTTYDDEFLWAAAELYVTTGSDTYLPYLDTSFAYRLTQPASWRDVDNLPLHTLAWRDTKQSSKITAGAADEVVRFADEILERLDNSPVGIPLDSVDYIWGSNGIAGNYAVSLGYAYRITNERKYLDGALATLDYLCGKNPLGYSFITGFGGKTPRHPHHRISQADSIFPPVPGFIVGGPNGKREDGLNYPSAQPELCYIDTLESYSSNEVAINWNAPFVFAAALVESEMNRDIPVRGGYPAGNRVMLPVAVRILPSATRILLQIRCTAQETVGWKIIDLTGRCIVSVKPQPVPAGTHTFSQPLKDLCNGIYLLKVTAGKCTCIQKFHVLR
ncbi:MAG: glycoside hydrolase family 9 protein [Chitinispirillaceae bacterium]|nr:glycoside hydrolase family 9 protein [Chitinispirillaceae bacterium]